MTTTATTRGTRKNGLYRYILTITATVETPMPPPPDYERDFARGFITGWKAKDGKGWNCSACNVQLEELS